MGPAVGAVMRILRAPLMALLFILFFPPREARANDCGDSAGIGVAFCAIAEKPLTFVVLMGGMWGTFLGGPSAVIAGGRNLYERDGDATWDMMGYVSGGFSIGGGAMLLGLGLTDFYNKKTEYLLPLGGLAVGTGILSILIPLLPDATPERELDDDFGRITFAPTIVIDHDGNAGPAFALSIGN